MARSPTTPLPSTPSGAPNPFSLTPAREILPSPSRINLVPSAPSPLDSYQLRLALRDAAQKCQERGLYYAARWASEQLVSIPSTNSVDQSVPPGDVMATAFTSPQLETPRTVPQAEEDACLLALAHFQLKEYDRAAWCLRAYEGDKALFIKCYAKYMSGEKRRAEQDLGHEVHLEGTRTTNAQLHDIAIALQKNEKNLDSFCWYLRGMIYARMKLKSKAQNALVQSLQKYAYNWSAWEEIGTLVETKEELEALIPRLPAGYMRKLFLVHLMAHRGMAAEEFSQNSVDLSAMFPDSTYLDLQYAVSYYNQGKYERALEYFEDYREQEPFSLEYVDVQSHILFTIQDSTKLSVLAQKSFALDRYRPETCIAIGNYFSTRRDHFRALDYFQRALKLRPNYVEALIMMGDEYMELKNSNAALETYQRAADVAPHDFRTWYGVAKAFDMLAMSDHAIPYYQKAAACRPYHSQTWTAMGQAFEASAKDAQAMMCFKRALICTDKSPLLFMYIAKLYQISPTLRDDEQAAFYYRCWIEECRGSGIDKSQYYFEWEDAVTFLAEFYKEKGRFEDAEAYVHEIAHTERGKALLRELRAVRESRSDHKSRDTLAPPQPATPGDPGSHGDLAHRTVQFVGGSTGEFWVSPVPGGGGQGNRYFGASAQGSARTSRTGSRGGSGWNSPAADDVR
ncbi:anaphase promoting complex subunit CDC23 [Spizellomyces punctatus DAOM BR117]|uniref:Cdc23 domain-containing protein n=1 Tax=Spizellomyces punctatus (strain DAOM BR117) TaxID=645134 RepID=A0A0L0HV34_SPIPD|nr:anaphase promoting complex subunit CDC23 [Spizellomyces punctatus DAOM BR117]KND04973.1 hypothetical protein SPPG_00659 [Spizellomyces punctatus DAOM BR117]|eukprot:XP_016613012.1 hypothetical protein SPPG_00659 [Spizellomyces punctatus DAOM BR117]